MLVFLSGVSRRRFFLLVLVGGAAEEGGGRWRRRDGAHHLHHHRRQERRAEAGELFSGYFGFCSSLCTVECASFGALRFASLLVIITWFAKDLCSLKPFLSCW